MSSSLYDSPLHDSPLRDFPLHDSQQLDSNEFCTTLRLPGRVYEAGEPPDNPKAIIHHSKIDYVEKGRVLTQGEDLWFTFSDQPMRFSQREFHLTIGLRCEKDQTITEPQFKIMKKPYLWMLGKGYKFTVRTLYEMFKEKARSMPTLERVSLGTTIITEAVIMAENPSSKISKDRLLHYMNYRLPKVAWGKTSYNILMRSVKSLSASSRTGDCYEVKGFALAINLWAMSSVHRSDWEQRFVDIFVATEDIGQQRKTKDKYAEHDEDLNHSEDEEEKKDEEYLKDKEQRKDKDHFMSNIEKLDKLIQMVRNLDKRVVVIQNVLGIEFNDGSPNKKDCDNGVSSGDRRSAQDYENEEYAIDEEAKSGDKKNAQDDGNEENTIAEEANSGDGKSAPDDENEEEICDEEANSGDGRSALADENEEEICDEEAKSGCEVEVSLKEDGFKGSWFRAILEQNPTRVKGEKLQVCYKTLLNEDSVNPCKETIERCFIRPVPPECLNEGVVFKEGSVADAYFSDGWWTGVIIVERPVGSFLVYFDDPPDIMRLNRSQLRPHADWTDSEWVKSKNKVLNQHMFRTGKLVEITRKISESEDIWVQALVITKIQGGGRRKFMIKRCTSSQNLSDEVEGKHTIVDICKIRSSPPRNLCAQYSLDDFVEVFVTHG
ncbi:unnamed protein product [Brassica oleracea]